MVGKDNKTLIITSRTLFKCILYERILLIREHIWCYKMKHTVRFMHVCVNWYISYTTHILYISSNAQFS